MKEKIIDYFISLPKRLPSGSYLPDYLQNKYAISILIFLAFIILAKLILFIFSKYLEKIAKKTETPLDNLLFEGAKKPVFYLVLIYGLKFSLLNVGIDNLVTKIINSLLALVFVLILSRLVDIIIKTWGESFARKTKTNLDEVLLPVFHRATKVIFIIIALMWVLNIWEVNITPYLAGAGIAGLVLGMALQDSLKNVFGGISLIMDKNFKVGDAIQLESGEIGTISEVGLRSTKMLTYDNEIIFIPNGQLANMKIRNFVRPNTRVRKIVDFSVEYGAEPEKVKKVVLSALKKVKEIYDEPYMDVLFAEMGDSGLHFKARFWADWDKAYLKRVEATQAIYAALNKANIGIPFPTRTVYLKK